MKVQARLKNYRISARKIREISPVLKGLDVGEAQWQLENLKKGCSEDLRKLLLSAISNAQNNHGLDKDNLFVSELIAQEGRTLKRWRPRAYGRATPIMKQSCHVILSLEEKEKGKRKKEIKDKQPVKGQEKEAEKKEDTGKGEKDETKDEKEAAENEKLPKGQPEANAKPSIKDKQNIKSEGTRKIFRRKSF